MPDLLTRLSDDLRADFRALSLSGPRANAALRTALASTLSIVAALALHLDDPSWAGITGAVIVQADLRATLSRSADRVIGTTIGAIVGFLGSATVGDHSLFLLIVMGSTGFVLYAQARAGHGYAYLLAGVTVVIVMFSALAAPDANPYRVPFARWAEIVVGVVVACGVDYLLAGPSATVAAAAPRPGVWTRPVDRELMVVAVTGGIAIGLIPLIWDTLDLPSLGQTPITAFVILTAMRQEPVWKATTRLAGCLLGGVYGLMALPVAGDAFLLWLALLFLGLYFAAHVAQGGGDAAYVGLQAAVAIIVAMVQGHGPSPDLMPTLDRLIGVFGGVLVIVVWQPLAEPLARRVFNLRR
jgi:uncharacterized membrane protein YccC